MTAPTHARFNEAVALIDAGDTAGLRRLLAAEPDVVHARAGDGKPHYDGYFAHATLLHHVAGNPIREAGLPANIVEVARVLLDAGAEVDAGCGGGPSQPDSRDWTPLGLVASGRVPLEAGTMEPLMELLVEHGADPDHRGGMNLWAALLHIVECPRQGEAAATLRRLGADVDLGFAAALGESDTVREFFAADGSLKEGAYRCWRPERNALDPGDHQAVLNEALGWAVFGGDRGIAGFLLDRGADPDALVQRAGENATALHLAVWADRLDMVRFLIERGADPHRRDTVHRSSPIGWAVYLRKDRIREYLASDDSRIDLRDAVEVDRLDLLQRLLGDGDPDQGFDDADRGVLFRFACAEGRLEIARFLLDRGADPNLKNTQGQTAADYARLFKQTKILEFLRSRGIDA